MYSLKVLSFLKVLEYKYEYKYFLKVRVPSTDEYCKISTRVPKYRSTEYIGPKPAQSYMYLSNIQTIQFLLLHTGSFLDP